MEIWAAFHEEFQDNSFITKTINNKEFAKELAFHEASHFVFQRLLHPFDLGFSESIHMNIDTIKRCGVVHGFMIQNFSSTHDYWTEAAYSQFKDFFTTDEKRLRAYCLELIAGYVSYTVFIENSSFFISFGDFKNNNNEVKLFKLETVPHSVKFKPPDKWTTGVSDFAKLKEQAGFINILDKEGLTDFYQNLKDDAQEIMSIKAVNLAIRHVKNRLLRMDGRMIEKQYFEKIKFFVDDLIKNVSIEEFLED